MTCLPPDATVAKPYLLSMSMLMVVDSLFSFSAFNDNRMVSDGTQTLSKAGWTGPIHAEFGLSSSFVQSCIPTWITKPVCAWSFLVRVVFFFSLKNIYFLEPVLSLRFHLFAFYFIDIPGSDTNVGNFFSDNNAIFWSKIKQYSE